MLTVALFFGDRDSRLRKFTDDGSLVSFETFSKGKRRKGRLDDTGPHSFEETNLKELLHLNFDASYSGVVGTMIYFNTQVKDSRHLKV